MALVWRANHSLGKDLHKDVAAELVSWATRRVSCEVALDESYLIANDGQGNEFELVHGGEDQSTLFVGISVTLDVDRQRVINFSLVEGQEESFLSTDIYYFGKWESAPQTPSILRKLFLDRQLIPGLRKLYEAHELTEPDEFLSCLLDPERMHAIVLINPVVPYRGDVLAHELALRVGGMAEVIVADTGRLNALLDPLDLKLSSDSVAISFPKAQQLSDLFSARLTVGMETTSPVVLADQVARMIQDYSTTLSVPSDVRQSVRTARQGSGKSDEELLEELVVLEELLEEERQLRAKLRLAHDRERDQCIAAEREIQALTLRLVPVAPDDGKPEPASLQPETCVDVVEFARRYLPGVAIPKTVDKDAAGLDRHANPSWPLRAWRSLLALDRYSSAKSKGSSGNFVEFCGQGGPLTIPKSWVGLHESESTSANKQLVDLRVLPVSCDVDPAGKIFMPAHIKVVAGGSPAPRIHFLDDTSGSTGKIHVGHFGEHLDTSSGV